jgi:hypothetical protein
MPATASAEQLADVALARCVDEIEIAAAALSGATQARIEVSRIAMRRELRDYAMAVASGPGTAPAESVAAVTW